MSQKHILIISFLLLCFSSYSSLVYSAVDENKVSIDISAEFLTESIREGYGSSKTNLTNIAYADESKETADHYTFQSQFGITNQQMNSAFNTKTAGHLPPLIIYLDTDTTPRPPTNLGNNSVSFSDLANTLAPESTSGSQQSFNVTFMPSNKDASDSTDNLYFNAQEGVDNMQLTDFYNKVQSLE